MKCMFNRYSCFHSAQCIKDFEGITLWPRMLGLIGHVALVAITGTTKLVPAYLVKSLPLLWWSSTCTCKFELWVPGGRFKNAYELLNLRALKCSPVNKMRIFQCMGKIFCVEFQRVPLKFHTKYLTHTLKDTIWYDVQLLRALDLRTHTHFETPTLILKWVAVTWWEWEGARIVVSTMATRHHAPLLATVFMTY